MTTNPGNRRSRSGFWRWAEDRPRVKVVIEDVELTIATLCGLLVVWIFLSVIRYLGYPANRVDLFDTLHYWATLAVMVNFLAGFVWNAFTLTFLQQKRT
jgi:hypothetical protein